MIAALETQNLSLKVRDKCLLDQVNLSFPKGEISLILGPNGSGKTLLLRCLAGVLSPHTGQVLIGTEPMHKKSREETAKILNWMPLSTNLPFAFSVIDLLIMGRYPQHQGFPGKRDRLAAETALQRLNLHSFAERSYNSLSRGEQTRVDIARALAADTSVLLFDEPFANLDIDASLQIIQLFHELREQGKTLILSHHDLYSARDLATYMIFLKQGRLVASGSSPSIFTPDIIRQTYDVEAEVREDQHSGDWFVRFKNLPH